MFSNRLLIALAFIFSLFVSPARAALTLDGSNFVHLAAGGNTSLTLSTTNANDIIIVVYAAIGAACSVSDGQGLTWTDISAGLGSGHCVHWARAPSALSSDLISLTTSGNAFSSVYVWGISGAVPSGSPLDGNASLPISSTVSNPTTFSTTNAQTFVFGCVTTGHSTETPIAGYTVIQDNTNFIGCFYQVFTSPQSSTNFGTVDGSNGQMYINAVFFPTCAASTLQVNTLAGAKPFKYFDPLDGTGTCAPQNALQDGADSSLGKKTDNPYVSGSGSVVSLLKALPSQFQATIAAGTDVVGAVSSDQCARFAKSVVAIAVPSTGAGGTVVLEDNGRNGNTICSFTVTANSAVNVALSQGASVSSGDCTNGLSAIIGSTTASTGMSLAANVPLKIGTGKSTIGSGASGHGLCIWQSGTAQLAGSLSYVQHP